jgi:hypothetical protein
MQHSTKYNYSQPNKRERSYRRSEIGALQISGLENFPRFITLLATAFHFKRPFRLKYFFFSPVAAVAAWVRVFGLKKDVHTLRTLRTLKM